MNATPSKRPLKVRIKSGKGRSLSSKLWLERQLNDPYVARAKRKGFRGRAAFRLMALAEAAADFAREVLAPGGAFLCKVLQGGTEASLLAALKRDFSNVKHVKPAASRSDSAELYLLATGFRGQR